MRLFLIQMFDYETSNIIWNKMFELKDLCSIFSLNISKRPSSCLINLWVVTTCDLDNTISRSWSNNSWWTWIKSNTHNTSFVQWLGESWISSQGDCNPEVHFIVVAAYKDVARRGSHTELVSLCIPSCIQVWLHFLDIDQWWQVSLSILTKSPNYDTSISTSWEKHICLVMPHQRVNITIVLH